MTKYTNQFIAEYDLDGQPLSGGLLNFYEAGTTNREPVYSDEALTTALSNPVVADSQGRFPTMYMQKIDYKIVLTDSSGVTIKTLDNADYTDKTLFDDIKQSATTTYAGVVKLATSSDVIVGTDDEKAVTSAAIKNSLEEIKIVYKGYINGGVVTNSSLSITDTVDISDCICRDSSDTVRISVFGNSLTITDASAWANGVVPPLTSADVYVFAVYDESTPYFILDTNVGGTNISVEKRRVGGFETNGSDEVQTIYAFELTDGSLFHTSAETSLGAVATGWATKTLPIPAGILAKVTCNDTYYRDNTGIVAYARSPIMAQKTVGYTGSSGDVSSGINEFEVWTETGEFEAYATSSGHTMYYTGFIEYR